MLEKLVVVGTGGKLSIKGLIPNDILHSLLIFFALLLLVYSKLLIIFGKGTFYSVDEI